MAESFVRSFKRDYVNVNDCLSAAEVLANGKLGCGHYWGPTV
jgi:hypothetical protein